MTEQTNKPRVSTDEMRTKIQQELEQKQELELTRRLLEEHKEDLQLVREMKPWFRAGRWLVGLVVSVTIGWVARGGLHKNSRLQKPVPCVQVAPTKVTGRASRTP